MADPPTAHLHLERRHANLHFSSWRLNSSILRSQGSVPLPAPAAPAQASDTDYVVARHAALLNGVTQQPRGCYAFLEEGEGREPAQPQLGLYQIDLGEASKPPQLHRVCGLPQQDVPTAGLAGGSLPPSVVEVQAAAGHQHAGTEAGSNQFSSLLLVSAGRGDVSLVTRPASGGPASTASPVFPLGSKPPLQGVRPLHLAAAFRLPQQGSNGGVGSTAVDICCILWAPRPRSERQPSRCEAYAVRLTAQLAPKAELQAGAVQLLRVSDLPPHGVLVNPAVGSVLLALQPSSSGAEDQAAAQRAAAAAAGERASGAAAMDADEVEGDVSPRTLQAAVARLAAFTSEEPVGPLPHQQYADLYREAGPDGIGSMGSEPTCALYTFALAGATPAATVATVAGAAAPAGHEGAAAIEQPPLPSQQGVAQAAPQSPLMQLVHTLSCQPHKLLTCHLEQRAWGAQEPATPDTHMQEGGGSGWQQQQAGSGSDASSDSAHVGPRLLLGLTDDVDCAVVAVSCSNGTVGSGNLAGMDGNASESRSSSGGAGVGGVEEGPRGFIIEHIGYVPAMAYVAAGKVQRKYLLLAPPGGDVACALVEAMQYAYLYRSVAARQEYGEHQVVDMELPDGGRRRGLLGAVLAGSRVGACRLVLLAWEGLRVIDM